MLRGIDIGTSEAKALLRDAEMPNIPFLAALAISAPLRGSDAPACAVQGLRRPPKEVPQSKDTPCALLSRGQPNTPCKNHTQAGCAEPALPRRSR